MEMTKQEHFQNAGLMGPLSTKDAGGGDTLTPEQKALADSVTKAVGELRTKLEAHETGKVGAGEFKEFASKVNADIDKMEKAMAESIRTMRGNEAAAAVPDDVKTLALDYFTGKASGKVYEGDLTPEHIAEAQVYAKSFNSFLRAGGDLDMMRNEAEKKALTSGPDPSGGYWVPTTMSSRIITKLHESTPMRQLATVEMTNGDQWEIPNDRGFVAARWVDDTSERENTDTPGLGMFKIPVHNLQAEPKASANLLEDANRNVEQWLGEKAAIGFALAEATAFISGNGVGKPRGLMTYDPIEYDKAKDKTDADWRKMRFVKSGNATAFGSLDAFANLITALKAQYRTNARFMMERTALGSLRLIKDGDGRYLLDYSNNSRGVVSLFGFPIAEGDDMDAVAANKFPVALGDFRAAYTIVQRRGIRVLRDPYTKKPMVQFDHTARVGGDVVDFDAFRVMKIAA